MSRRVIQKLTLLQESDLVVHSDCCDQRDNDTWNKELDIGMFSSRQFFPPGRSCEIHLIVTDVLRSMPHIHGAIPEVKRQYKWSTAERGGITRAREVTL